MKNIALLSCLMKPSYSLRKQLLLSYGILSAITIGIVILATCIQLLRVGDYIKEKSMKLTYFQIQKRRLEYSATIADTLTSLLINLEGSASLTGEIARDRIVGYPLPGWEDDIYVPFKDYFNTSQSKYPLNSTYLPLDWDYTTNINKNNALEHLQEERLWMFGRYPSLSTAHGIYFMQGGCDPAAKPNTSKYYPNCSIKNNNITTGGVVRPTPTNAGLYAKSADIAVLLKPIYEAHVEILNLGIMYANSGAGSYVVFPGDVRDSNVPSYISAGCDWMRERNPYTNESFGTEEEIARCHPNGTVVPQREYNVLERNFCKTFALAHVNNTPDGDPSKFGGVHWFGPFKYFGSDLPIVVAGQAIFDRRTGHFIACSGISIYVSAINDILSKAKNRPYGDRPEKARNNTEEEIAIVRLDGTVFISSSSNDTSPIPVTSNNFISESDFNELKACVLNEREMEFIVGHHSPHRGCNLTSNAKFYTAFSVLGPRTDAEARKNAPLSFMLVHSIPMCHVVEVANEKDQIDDNILHISIGSVVLGFVGFCWIIGIIWIVSKVLTAPLIWMESVAWKIINHTEDDIERTSLGENDPVFDGRCTPSTEITILVSDFRKMICGFSGTGVSTVAHADLKEIRNEITWQSDFQELYTAVPSSSGETNERKRRESLLNVKVEGADKIENEELDCIEENQLSEPKATVEDSQNADESDNIIRINTEAQDGPKQGASVPLSKSIVPAFPKTNLNKNVLTSSGDKFSKKFSDDAFVSETKVPILRSALFWWLLVLIVIPLLLTNAAIFSIVSGTVNGIVPTWTELVQNKSLNAELETVNLTAGVKAKGGERVIQKVSRDLHVATRVAGWLFFDAINRSNGVIYVEELSEECKKYPGLTCPEAERRIRHCPCEWEDMRAMQCTNYSNKDTRTLQQSFFAAERRDYDNSTGDRLFVAKKLHDSQRKTKYWNNISEMPGFKVGRQPSGFRTVFDRVTISATLGVVTFPLYNYATKIGRDRHIITSLIATDADGMISGYSGCNAQHVTVPQWEASEKNGATQLAPELCPSGKFGFDPRCRSWYTSGKSTYMERNVSVFVAAPYKFAVEDLTAQSITAPVADPRDGSYVGQMLIDFFGLNILDNDDDLSFLITPDTESNHGKMNDTVEGPNFEDGETADIVDLLFPMSDQDSENRDSFEREILSKMKKGESGDGTFRRTYPNGTIETVHVYYRPVYGTSLLPLDTGDFSRGVNVSKILLYSLAMSISDETINRPWEQQYKGIEDEKDRLRMFNLAIVVVVSVLFLLISCFITLTVTRPMVTLLQVVQAIAVNRNESGIPPMKGGSSEVVQVYHLFSKLYKIVRGSNVAFFSGNLAWAYNFINEALKLFRKVGDEKAIGIACSNLGNTLHAIRHDEVILNETKKMPQMEGMAEMALDRYDEAIRIAETHLEREKDEEKRIELIQQLADRLFNRALFVYLLNSEGNASDDLITRSLNDITRVSNLDYEAKCYWLNSKTLLEKSNDHFYRLLQRAMGLMEYYDELNTVWNAEALVNEADQFLIAAWNEPDIPLFDDVSRVGRLQQLELVAIQLELRKNRKYEAGRLAMRMFVEDEYLIEDAFKVASIALMELFRDEDEWPYHERASRTKLLLESDLRKMLKSCRQVSLDLRKCVIFAFEVNEAWEGQNVLDEINKQCLSFFDNYCMDDDYLGIVAYTTRGDLNFPLQVKADNAGIQRSTLDLATTSTSERVCSAIPYAIQMLIDCSATAESDSFILLVTDGYSWDSSIVDPVMDQLEKLNSERYTNIHLIILGIEIEQEEIIQDCKRMCSITAISKYIDVISANDNVNQIFETVRNIVRGGVVHAPYHTGIMMEKF